MKKCVKGNQLWSDSKHFSVSAYRINSDPHDIMAEVYTNGPVEVAFTVYEVKLSMLLNLFQISLEANRYLINIACKCSYTCLVAKVEEIMNQYFSSKSTPGGSSPSFSLHLLIYATLL